MSSQSKIDVDHGGFGRVSLLLFSSWSSSFFAAFVVCCLVAAPGRAGLFEGMEESDPEFWRCHRSKVGFPVCIRRTKYKILLDG
jgi:hypothetical protein